MAIGAPSGGFRRGASDLASALQIAFQCQVRITKTPRFSSGLSRGATGQATWGWPNKLEMVPPGRVRHRVPMPGDALGFGLEFRCIVQGCLAHKKRPLAGSGGGRPTWRPPSRSRFNAR